MAYYIHDYKPSHCNLDMKKEDARKQTREALHDRRKLVVRLHQEGMPVMQIVECSGLSWSAVNAAIKRYETGGDEALMPAARGRKQGTDRVLRKEQEIEIHRLICRKRPWQCKFKSHRFWNRNLVMQLIERLYGMKLSVRGLDNYLERWGLTLENQKKRPYVRCSKSIKKWLDKNYSAIEQEARTKNAQIYWINKTVVKYPNETASGEKRPKLWMITIATNQGKTRRSGWLVIKRSFNARNQISFLKALILSARKKIFLISENSKIDFSANTMNWIKRESKDMIKIFSEKPYPHKKKSIQQREKQRKVIISDYCEMGVGERMGEPDNWIP